MRTHHSSSRGEFAYDIKNLLVVCKYFYSFAVLCKLNLQSLSSAQGDTCLTELVKLGFPGYCSLDGASALTGSESQVRTEADSKSPQLSVNHNVFFSV